MNKQQTQHIVASTGDNPLSCWNKGGLVVVPTETVYGLSADAENNDAVARIYALKNRPRFNPLIVHVGSVEIAQKYGVWNDDAAKLAAAFWPGPLAMILPLMPDAPVSDLVTAGGNTVALRMPNHPTTLNLLREFGRGVAAPSANRSGRISPTSPNHVRDEFGEDCPMLIEGGDCSIGLESTVIDLSGETPQVLRPGAITKEEIIKTLGKNINVKNQKNTKAIKSPGMLKSHYAPTLPVRLNVTELREGEALIAFGNKVPAGASRTINISETGDVAEAATKLFHALRELDVAEHSAIAVMPIPNEGIGDAINDRLARAAADRQ